MHIGAARGLGLVLLLAPSAYFAWRTRDMPQLGALHDDSVYYVSAKSLAVGGGYRILSLPGEPPQTKFPPAFPWYLSWAWRINPLFPSNLPAATLFAWVLLTVNLLLCFRLFREYGFERWRLWILLGLYALNPYVALFGVGLFSEMFFSCFVLGSLLLSRGSSVGGGVLGAVAYLGRAAGLALLVSQVAWELWKRRFRRAATFATPMLVAWAGWMLWVRSHLAHTSDPALMYYIDYGGFRALNFGLDNLPMIVWKNVDQLLLGMGSLILPKVFDSLLLKILAQVIAVAMIAGVVRLARRGVGVDYALFSLISAGLLVIWHYPPNERFVLPLFPLLLVGLLVELEHMATMLRGAFRHPDAGQRVVARVFAALLAVVFGGSLLLELYVANIFLPLVAEQQRGVLRQKRQAYAWIREHVPPDAGVLAYEDPLMYLETGRKSMSLPLAPRYWYADDSPSRVDAYRKIGAYARAHGLSYVYFTSEDLQREVGDEDRKAIQEVVRANPELERVFTAGIGSVYRVRP